MLGHALADQGQTDAAIEAYRDALRHDPDLPGLHNNLGLALRQAGQLEDAATHLRQAVAHEPSDVQAQSNLAGLLKELGRLDEAEALLPRGPAAAPRRTGLHYQSWARAAAGGSPRRRMAGIRVALSRRHRTDTRLRAATLARRATRWPDIADPGRAGLRRYHPVLSLRAVGGRRARCPGGAAGRCAGWSHGLQGVERIVGAGEPLPDFDLYVPLLSLPHLLGLPRRSQCRICAPSRSS